MHHRHLNDPGFTLAAIDDLIERGNLSDWIDLAIAVKEDSSVRAKVERIVDARSGEESTINHDFRRTRLRLRPRDKHTRAD